MAKKLTPAEPENVYVYIGPSVYGLLQSGTIYRGTKADVMARLKLAAERYPMLDELIARDTDLAAARQKIKQGGTLLAKAYAAMLKKEE